MALEQKPLVYRRTVIYLRVSSNEQNPENQLKECESIRPIDNKTETFIDYYLIKDTQSAFKENINRAGFTELLKLIKKKKVKNIIVWDLDRIYRNRYNLIEFFTLCKTYKTKILSYRQKWLEDINNIPKPFNEIFIDFFIQIMGWMAEEESIKKSERVKSAITHKKGVTFSKFGNKWGRKNLSTQKKNKIIKFKKEYPKSSLRFIANELKVSVGVVHKVLKENELKKQAEKIVNKCTNK